MPRFAAPGYGTVTVPAGELAEAPSGFVLAAAATAAAPALAAALAAAWSGFVVAVAPAEAPTFAPEATE